MTATQAILLQPGFIACLDQCIQDQAFIAVFDRLMGHTLSQIDPLDIPDDAEDAVNRDLDALIWYVDEFVYRRQPKDAPPLVGLIRARVAKHLMDPQPQEVGKISAA